MVLPVDKRERALATITEGRETEVINEEFRLAQQRMIDFVLRNSELGLELSFKEISGGTKKGLLLALESRDDSDLKIFFFGLRFGEKKRVLQVCTEDEGRGLVARLVDVEPKTEDGYDIILAQTIDDDPELDGVVFNVVTRGGLGYTFEDGSQDSRSVNLSLGGEMFTWDIVWRDGEGEGEESKKFKKEFNEIVKGILMR